MNYVFVLIISVKCMITGFLIEPLTHLCLLLTTKITQDDKTLLQTYLNYPIINM